MIDEEDGEDEQGIGDNVVLDDDVDEDMLKNGIDDNDNIINPFNTISRLNDDIDVEFDDVCNYIF